METKGIYPKDAPSVLGIGEYELENIFKLYAKNSVVFLNIGKKVIIPTDLSSDLYYLKRFYNQPLTTLSYDEYGTPNLWWLILYANRIYNPIAQIPNGTILRIPTPAFVRHILDAIKLEMANSQ